MPNLKITQLTAATSVATTDILPVVIDPGTSPANRKITVDNFQKSLNQVGKVVITQPATGSTLTIQDGFTLTANGNAVVSGTNTGDQDLSGLVTKATYDANTILKADADNTPLALTVGENTIVGRITAGVITALTGTQVTAILDNFVGDLGAGGTKGLVPAPAAGDATAGKFLKADGSWVAPGAATATKLETARSIYGNSFDGTADLTQVIASTYGGTGNGFTKFTGPTTAEKTFTLPDNNATILTDLTAAAAFATSVTIGAASSSTGSLILANAGSGFTTTIQAGNNITASRTYIWPTDFGAAGTVLTDVAGNGTLSWAAGFAWGTSISGTTADGLTLTLNANSNAAASAISILANNTQANKTACQLINIGTSTNAAGIIIKGLGQAAGGDVGAARNALTIWGNADGNAATGIMLGNGATWQENVRIMNNGTMSLATTAGESLPNSGFAFGINPAVTRAVSAAGAPSLFQAQINHRLITANTYNIGAVYGGYLDVRTQTAVSGSANLTASGAILYLNHLTTKTTGTLADSIHCLQIVDGTAAGSITSWTGDFVNIAGSSAYSFPSFRLDKVGDIIWTAGADSSGIRTAFTLNAGANTGQTASNEVPDFNLNLARTVTWATGALTTERFVRIQRPTVAFAGASTLTTGILVSIEGAPSAGTNATITNALALQVGGATTQVSGANLIYRAIDVPAHTLTVTGTTQVTSTMISAVGIGQLTITDASAVTVDKAASLYIANAPVAAGSVTLTKAWSVYVGAGASMFNGSTVIGTAALATNATDGFLYVPSCAGTPTGVPTTQTGTVPLVYDTTNEILYAYVNGAWV